MSRSFMMVMVLFLLGEVPDGHADTAVCGPLTTDHVWTAEAGPIVVTCDVVVPQGVTLTIQPGVDVRFKRRVSLTVDGALMAQGTETAPILFTSHADPPYPGDWGGISFSASSLPASYDDTGQYRGGSLLRYAVLQFGGSSRRTGMVEIRGAGPYLENVIIHKNGASAVMVDHGTVRIRSSRLAQNSNSQGFGGGILAFSSTLIIEDSAIVQNSTSGGGGGIHATHSVVTIQNSTLERNETAANGGALFATDSAVTVEGSVFSENRSPVRGGAIYAARSTVTIARSRFEDNRTLRTALQGSPSQEGGLPVMGAGLFVTDATLTITHSAFLRNTTDADCAALAAAESSLVLTGTVFLDNVSAGHGAALCLDRMADGSSMTYNTIAGNRSEKAALPNIIYLRAGRFPTLTQNNISNNVGYDVLSEGREPIEAGDNWWGTTEEAAIRGRMYSRAQDAGAIRFTPVLPAPVMPPPVATSAE